MLETRSLLLFLSLVSVVALSAQPVNSDCAGALTLCAGQPISGDNTGATGVPPSICQPGGDLLWYTFTTNSVGGVVNVSLSGINCPNIAGMDNELSVVVLSGDGTCLPASFGQVAPCAQDSMDFTWSSAGFFANTQYWIVVAGAINNGATQIANCGFNVTTSGPGADVVGVDFFASPDVILAEGSNTQLLATGGTTYVWSPSTGLSGDAIADPFAQPTESTTYTVTTTINGCTYTDDVLVDVKRLISPPNTITPNGDDHNDVWDIIGINDYPQSKVSIYDRWGQRVFSSVGYKEPFTGEGLPTATYYWVIDLNVLQGVSEPYTGFLTIIN
jgi:gliding motility-associated-like protein